MQYNVAVVVLALLFVLVVLCLLPTLFASEDTISSLCVLVYVPGLTINTLETLES